MPAWLAWLLPVLLAPGVAAAWTAWSGRERGPERPEDSVAQHARFRAALHEPGRAPRGSGRRRGLR